MLSFLDSTDWIEIAFVIVGIILCAVFPPFIVVVVLIIVGFTTGGVAFGSMAAAWMSNIGIVSAGSLFAYLQSIGTLGFGLLLAPAVIVLEVVVALVLTAYFIYKYFFGDGKIHIPPSEGSGEESDVVNSAYTIVSETVDQVTMAVSPCVNLFLSVIVNGLAGMISGLFIAAVFIYFRGGFEDKVKNERIQLLSDHRKKTCYWEAVLLPLAGLLTGICIGFIYPYHFF